MSKHSSSNTVEKLQLPPLPPIPNTFMEFQKHNNTQKEVTQESSKWRDDYRSHLRSKAFSTPDKKKKAIQALIEKRKILLIKCDIACTYICEATGIEYALPVADQVRQYLSIDEGDNKAYLTMWRQPEEDLEGPRITLLMGLRPLVAMARLSLDLMGEKDIAFPDWQKFYVAILVDRLTWNPVARQHFDDVNKLVGGYQYSLMDLGRQDAKKILEKLNQNFGPRWEGHNNTLMQQRWRYAKAYVLRSFSAKLLLPEISKAAKVIEEEAVKNIRENYWVCSSPEAYEKLASDAEKLVAMLPFHCKWSDWHPELADPEEELEEFDQTLKSDRLWPLAKKWGFENINLRMKAEDIEKLLADIKNW